MFMVSFLLSSLEYPPPATPSLHSVGSLHSTHRTNPSLWVLQIPLGQGAEGVGTGSLPVMNSTGTAFQFHHSKNCSHGALNTVKTNKSKYLELIHELFGFSPTLMDSSASEYRYIYILLQNWLCILGLMIKTFFEKVGEHAVFFSCSLPCIPNPCIPKSILW